MQAKPQPSSAKAAGLTGRHVLANMLGMFSIIFAVNGYMLFKALSDHSGLVANEPYRKGLEYNQRIAADERQAALGWTSTAALEPTGRVSIVMTDTAGQPVSNIAVQGRLSRPASSKADHTLAFKEQRPGTYVADAGSIEAGTWQLDITVRPPDASAATAGEPIYRMRRRLWVKP